MGDIRKKVIKENEEKQVQLVSYVFEFSDGRTTERFGFNYKEVTLPFIKDLEMAEALYRYLSGEALIEDCLTLPLLGRVKR